MFRKKIVRALFGVMLAVTVFLITSPVFAQGTPAKPEGILPRATGEPSCSANDANICGDYQVSDFVVLAIKVSNWILGIVGSLTLIMFIYGGVMFLISAGASDKVDQAKKIIVAAIIGLLIVFSSWLIIKYTTETIGAPSAGLTSPLR